MGRRSREAWLRVYHCGAVINFSLKASSVELSREIFRQRVFIHAYREEERIEFVIGQTSILTSLSHQEHPDHVQKIANSAK
jgi:hypothetical protein